MFSWPWFSGPGPRHGTTWDTGPGPGNRDGAGGGGRWRGKPQRRLLQGPRAWNPQEGRRGYDPGLRATTQRCHSAEECQGPWARLRTGTGCGHSGLGLDGRGGSELRAELGEAHVLPQGPCQGGQQAHAWGSVARTDMAAMQTYPSVADSSASLGLPAGVRRGAIWDQLPSPPGSLTPLPKVAFP